MKFCPYCGASLVGGAVSFCAECGKPLPGKGQKPPEEPAARFPAKKMRAPVQPPLGFSAPNPADEHYDGYYNDVPPIDEGRTGKPKDPELVKRVAFVILGAVGLITLSTVLLMLL